ncbi:hypothetical protein AZE42_10946 [Rhizopogon vesiculosus]|uniref:Uncharacterized protein n=1 Tax=Rhizopogon vesiculosus TaxID=180088 RepID=A0A1J8QQ31_9AGAM|nr:hypothetical protein AZE42_10946 [Rhizopogon vesiculosus]
MVNPTKGEKVKQEPRVPKRPGKSRMEISDTEEVETGDNEAKASKGLNINWDAKSKQGLFPPPGANVSTKNSGRKLKTEHQWALCVALFTEHPVYSPSFALIKTVMRNSSWNKSGR